MVQRYFVEPYRFIPPYRSTIWCRLVGQRIVPKHLRRQMGVPRWHFTGIEHLQDSLRRKAGILLASNHCRWADPLVLAMLGLSVRRYFYYLASYHLFKRSRLMGWWINRHGGYSILREGTDREAIRATAALLAEDDRPVVLFPEGTWFRQNDHLNPLQEGVALMVRQAIKQTERPILVHPVALKYWALQDPLPALRQRLDHLEARIDWQPQRQLELLPRIEKLSAALLTIKEIELFGQAAAGTIDERVQRLADAHVCALEKQYLGKEQPGSLMERVRRLRLALVKKLVEVVGDAERTQQVRLALDRLLLVENLNAHSHEYLLSRPSLERLIETVQRIEEAVTDQLEVPVVPSGATLTVAPAIDVRALYATKQPRGQPDPLIQLLSRDIQGLLDQMLAQGPPREWNCPAPIEPTTPAARPTVGKESPSPLAG